GDVVATATVNGVPRRTPLTSSFTVLPRRSTSWTWGPLNHWKFSPYTGKACGSGLMLNNETMASYTRVGWNRRTGGCSAGTLTPDPFATSTNGYSVRQV